MPTPPTASIVEHFAHLDDPRVSPATRHQLLEIVAIAIYAADTWVEVEVFGRAKAAWLRTFLTLSHEIPSHDTLLRLEDASTLDLFDPSRPAIVPTWFTTE